MDSKNKIIEKVYYDPGGFGSITATLKDAKKYDKSITYDDVKKMEVFTRFWTKSKNAWYE